MSQSTELQIRSRTSHRASTYANPAKRVKYQFLFDVHAYREVKFPRSNFYNCAISLPSLS